MAFFWDLWTKHCSPGEQTHMLEDILKTLGKYVGDAAQTLPSIFCGHIRNPHTKRHSQYKIFKWMALLHWYLIPMLYELGFNDFARNNFIQFVWIIEYTMTIEGRTKDELEKLYMKIAFFLKEFEELYVVESANMLRRDL